MSKANWLQRMVKRLTGNWWQVRRCVFPFTGYATYLPAKRMILDSGLTKQEAQGICNELNGV